MTAGNANRGAATKVTGPAESKANTQDGGADSGTKEGADETKKSSDRAAKKRPKEAKEPKEKEPTAPKTGGAATTASSRETPAREARIAANPANAPMPPTDGSLSADAVKAASVDCRLSDKDIAREAWRRNWPTICPLDGGEKAFIVIPLKGSIAGEVHELRHHPNREARVVLPLQTESQLTLKQYKLNRFGFKELKIGPMDDGRTRLRVRLAPESGDPIFDVKEGYAKVTVATSGGGT